MTTAQFCRMCGRELKTTDKFCLHCGAKVLPTTQFCRMCGRELDVGNKFCQHCGSRVLLIKKEPKAKPVYIKPEVVEPEYEFADPNQEIALLQDEHLLFPPKTIKIKFHKGYFRKWILDPIVGLVLWGVSAVLIFLIFDDGWNYIRYGTGKFANLLEEGLSTTELLAQLRVWQFMVIGVIMLILGWLWSFVNLMRGPPKVDLFATNQRLILRDDERTGFLTRAVLGVNIFLVLRNPLHIMKTLRTYREVKHQFETSQDEMDYEYLIMTKEGCIKNVHMQKISFFIPALVLLVLMLINPYLILLGIPFLILLILSIIFRLFKRARPRIQFQQDNCQGQLRYFVESGDLDLIGLMPDQETAIMQTYSS
ncbi:MAG: zinc-ribbon domain-containing protein [Candidatus Heimdallarchaeota archaeon]